MKRPLLSLIGSLFAVIAGATGSTDDILPADRNHLTIDIAYDVSVPGDWKLDGGSFKMFKPGGGVSLGVDYLWLIGRNFFFEPGGRIFFDSYRYNGIAIGDGTIASPSQTFDPPVRKIGMRIPLTVGYKFDIFKRGSLLLATGVEPSVGFSERTKVDKDLEEIFQENMYDTLMRRYDIAWDLRGSIIIDRLRIAITGSIGMLNVIKTDAKMHTHHLSLSLGYLF